jgi:Tfp pilus assembly protein PilO
MVLSFLVLAVFFFLWIKPALTLIETYDNRAVDLNFKIEKQNKLVPLYLQLKQRKKAQLPQVLIIPARTRISKSELETLLPLFKAMADKTGLTVITVKPDVAGLENNHDFITTEIVVRGSFFAFHDFLLELAKVPFLESVEGIFIQQMETEKEFAMKLSLAIE